MDYENRKIVVDATEGGMKKKDFIFFQRECI
jgi:hypothetical protein